ncbi:cysteine desulfurase family protein [Rhizobium ruizarguesonis]
MIRAYLDNNATTRPSPEVVAAMMPYFTDLYANPSSAAGQIIGIDKVVSDAKRSAGRLLGSPDLADGVVFTSGASESNSWAFAAAEIGAGSHIVSTAFEHSSILAAGAAAAGRGAEVTLVGCDFNGVIDQTVFEQAVRPETRLVSVMLANNETGVVQPVKRLFEIARSVAPDCLIHCDVTQAVGRIPVDLYDDLFDIDLASFSAHKFHGPKGIGGMFIRPGVQLPALVHGEQERGQRGGTVNSTGAAGLAVACDLALNGQRNMSEIARLRNMFEFEIVNRVPGTRVNGSEVERLPNTSSVTIDGVASAALVEKLATRGVFIANGSACTAGSDAPSHVLTAMGLSYDQAFQTIRVSLSRETTSSEIELAVDEIARAAR